MDIRSLMELIKKVTRPDVARTRSDITRIMSGLNDIAGYLPAVLDENTYTLDLDNRQFKNFRFATVPDMLQIEIATAEGTVTADPGGDVTVTVTSAAIPTSPVVLTVPVLLNDNAAAIGDKIRAAIAANTAITDKFTVSGDTAQIILTSKTAASNDSTLNIAIATGTAAGVTAVPDSANNALGGIAAKTIAVTNVPAEAEIKIELTATEPAAITWPWADTDWLSGSKPTFEAEKRYRIVAYTSDGGAKWDATIAGGW